MRHEKNFNQIFFLKSTGQKLGLRQQSTFGLRSAERELNSLLTVNAISDKWISDKGWLNGKPEDVKSFNVYLDRVQSRIYDIFQDFISSGIEFDGERIKAPPPLRFMMQLWRTRKKSILR